MRLKLEDQVKTVLLARLLGQRWEDAFKIGAPTEAKPERSATSYLLGDDDEEFALDDA